MVAEKSIVVPLKQFEANQFGDSQVDRVVRNGHGILSYISPLASSNHSSDRNCHFTYNLAWPADSAQL